MCFLFKLNKANESLRWADHYSHSYQPLCSFYSLALCHTSRDTLSLSKPLHKSKTNRHMEKPQGCRVTGFRNLPPLKGWGGVKKKKIHPQNNDSKEKEASSKRGIRAAANTHGVRICHCTFESIRVKFCLKHN